MQKQTILLTYHLQRGYISTPSVPYQNSLMSLLPSTLQGNDSTSKKGRNIRNKDNHIIVFYFSFFGV